MNGYTILTTIPRKDPLVNHSPAIRFVFLDAHAAISGVATRRSHSAKSMFARTKSLSQCAAIFSRYCFKRGRQSGVSLKTSKAWSDLKLRYDCMLRSFSNSVGGVVRFRNKARSASNAGLTTDGLVLMLPPLDFRLWHAYRFAFSEDEQRIGYGFLSRILRVSHC